jgi:hypothetical protein
MKYDAILALHNESNPNTKLLIRGDVEELTDLSIVQSNGKTPSFTWDEVLTKEAELLSEYDAQEYARNRQPLYPAIGDQLDDLYHAGVFSAEMTATLKKVKDDNPK